MVSNDPKLRNFGCMSVTVPAVVAGLAMALEKFGTMSWADVSRHAMVLAEEGYVIDAELKGHLDNWVKRADKTSFKALCRDGTVPAAGERWIQNDLARLLRRLASDGPSSFYEGEITRAITKQVRAGGGCLAEEDFAAYRARLVEPLSIRYQGHQIHTPPPPSGGLTSLAILKTLESFELSELPPWGAEYFHLFAEASKLCWQERARYLGDPDFMPVPIRELLSDSAAARRADAIREGSVTDGAPHPFLGGPHTANVCTADSDGNVVSMTATQGYQFGSQVVIDGLGLIMGHGMSRFDYEPGHPNAPAAGKRMHHNMSPTIALRDGRPCFAVGLPGGPKIVSVTAQLCVSLIDFGATPQQAVVAPRAHTEAGEPLGVSSAMREDVIAELARMGHTIKRGQDVGGRPTEIGGPANAIVINDTGRASAASGVGPDAALLVPSPRTRGEG
jgi:gamma-glutamyltranspeptidase/glutathione hydrolase